MSTELKTRADNPLALTRFFGGKHGSCLQLTQKGAFEPDGRININWREHGAYEGLYTSIRLADLPALIADLQAIVDDTIEED